MRKAFWSRKKYFVTKEFYKWQISLYLIWITFGILIIHLFYYRYQFRCDHNIQNPRFENRKGTKPLVFNFYQLSFYDWFFNHSNCHRINVKYYFSKWVFLRKLQFSFWRQLCHRSTFKDQRYWKINRYERIELHIELQFQTLCRRQQGIVSKY